MRWTKEKLYLVILFIVLIVSIISVLYFNRSPGYCDQNGEGYEAHNRRILVLNTSGDTKTDKQLPKYDLIEYSPLLDSNNMSPKDWVRIALDITKNYDKYDAFIIIHGVDTLSYTASALSFMLENLNKTVIVTENIGAVIVASKYRIPEVVVCDGTKICRGCRYNTAFPSLGNAGQLNDEIILDFPVDPFKFMPINPKNRVVVVRMFPGIDAKFMNGVTRGGVNGIVLEAFESGEGPTDKSFLKAIRELVKRGVVIVVKGNSTELEMVGVINGLDMTTEVIVAKIYFLLSHLKEPSHHLLTELIQKNMRGELSDTA